jgi:DNA polymerase I-like protein with 3'-5' exonuclease and polymerase domains
MFGRKRWIRLTGDEKKDEAAYRKAANTPIQGTAEGINTLSFRTLVNLYEKLGVKSMVISSIHDATLFQMHLDELEDLKDVTLYYMENLPIDFMTVTNLKVDWAEGNTWGECK